MQRNAARELVDEAFEYTRCAGPQLGPFRKFVNDAKLTRQLSVINNFNQ
jgi:hypothetical protein